MTDRAHVRVIRGNHCVLPSLKFERRQSVPIVSSLSSVQVVKLPRRSHHQSINSPDTHQSSKVDVKSINIIRKVASSASSTRSTQQQSINADDTLQSVSIITLDPEDTNQHKCSVNRQENNTQRSISSQSRHSNRTRIGRYTPDSMNSTHDREEYHNKHSSSINIRPTTNYRKIPLTKSNLRSKFNDIKLIGNPPNQKEFNGEYLRQYRHEKRRYLKRCCACLPLCLCLSMIGLLFLGAIIAGIVVALVSLGKTTTTTTTKTTTTTTTSVSTTSTSTSSTTTTTSVTSTTTTTAIPCLPGCNSEQTCLEGICVNVGHLACTLTWSRPGDGDIVVTTPNGKTIHYNNKGPSSTTDQAILDRDDQVNTGPENVYWPNAGPLPPTGTYYICFEPYQFNSPTISITNPITVVYRIVRPTGAILIFTRTFTTVLKNSYQCDATSNTLVGSFTYP